MAAMSARPCSLASLPAPAAPEPAEAEYNFDDESSDAAHSSSSGASDGGGGGGGDGDGDGAWPALAVGAIATVASRTGPGENLPGGVVKITAVHLAAGAERAEPTYDVAHVIGARRERTRNRARGGLKMRQTTAVHETVMSIAKHCVKLKGPLELCDMLLMRYEQEFTRALVQRTFAFISI